MLFFEPLNPRTPALAHDMVFPNLSVKVTMVLLNVAFMEGQNAIDRHPNYWKLHARLGVLYYEASLVSENEDDIIKYRRNAEKLFKDSIKLGPSRDDVYKMLITLYIYYDEYEEAAMIAGKYKNFLDSIHVELDSSYYQMNSIVEYGNCTSNTKDYFVINKCIVEIK